MRIDTSRNRWILGRPSVLGLALCAAGMAGCAGAQKHAGEDAKVAPTSAHPAAQGELFTAAETGDLGTVKRLLAAGTHPDAPAPNGMRALWAAAFRGHTEVAKALLAAGAKVDAKYACPKDAKAWQSPASHARGYPAAEGGVEACGLRLPGDSGERDEPILWGSGQQALHFAAAAGKLETVKLLLAAGAKVDAEDDHGVQPLIAAAMYGRTGMVRLLLASGAKMDAADAMGYQPIHWASLGGRAGMVKVLLAAGAKADAKTNRGEQPLYFAAGCDSREEFAGSEISNDYRQTMESLLAAGAKANAAAKDGSQPIHLAAAMGNLNTVKWLQASGADITAKDNAGKTPADYIRQEIAERNPHGKAGLNDPTMAAYRALDAYLSNPTAHDKH